MNRKLAINRGVVELAYSKDRVFTAAEEVRAGILLKMAGEGRSILDLGCYNGRIGSLLRAAGNKVFGMDLSEYALKTAHEKGLIPLKADASEVLPFKDNTFDVVVAAEIIEHVFNIENFLIEIRRILKKEGSLVLSTPNLASFGRRLYLLFGRNPAIEIGNEQESAGHIRYFVKESLFKLLVEHGFEISLFCSDVVNFDNSGKNFSRLLAKIFPGFGKSLIVKAINK
jgi:2-polyprenyl-3-methyl-5-hydroxy-6-metoxy-1,4-benzoquinol methylase